MVDASDRGGIALYTAALIAELRGAGVDVALAAPQGREIDARPIAHVRWGHEVDEIPARLRKLVLLWERVRRAATVLRAVRDARPLVVHLQTTVSLPFDPLLLRYWRWKGIRIVRTVHNAVAHDDTRASIRDRGTWDFADVLIAHSAAAAAVLREAVPAADVRLVPVDLPRSSSPSRHDARRALDLDDAPIALLLGLIRQYKGVDLLAAAWPAVRTAVPAAKLFVVGSLLEPIAALDQLRELDGVTVRVGWLHDDDVARWAAAADVCLLPYAHGGHSAVLHQAVVAGTPVIASPPLSEEVTRFDAGLIVDLEPHNWSAAMSGALSDEPLAPPRMPQEREQARATAAIYEELRAP